MKRPYIKPELVYENFQLAQSIAACDLNYHGSSTTVDSCYASGDISGGMNVFYNDHCEFKDLEGYCITNSSIGFTTFNS